MAAEVAPLSPTDFTESNAQTTTISPNFESPNDPPAMRLPPSESTTHSQVQPLDESNSSSSAPPILDEPAPRLSPQDAVDFLLHPAEVERGRTAAENYLNTCRSDETRRVAQEALETLATVISDGRCEGLEFPWQQVRPYHGAAALTILKEKGAPARIEALRCRRDVTRSYRVAPEAFPPGQVQKIRTTLSKVIEECSELGFIHDDIAEEDSAKAKKGKAATRGRLLGDGELRALVAASTACENAEGSRDAVLFALVYRGLKIAEITTLTIDSVRFNNKTGACNIVPNASGAGGRGRKIEMTNADLICLEDWLDYRGEGDGPLLCSLGRGGKIEGKRLTIAVLKEICERRSKESEVAPFVPNDLSRSADALTDHRKAIRRKAAKLALTTASNAEIALFDGSATADKGQSDPKAIRFPFLGLGI